MNQAMAGTSDKDNISIDAHHMQSGAQAPDNDTASQGKSIYDLPAELRNEIYGYALRQNTPVRPGRIDSECALLRVSRQVREEAIWMYYAVNDLEFDFRDNADMSLRAPAVSWAYYHVPAGTMLVGQKLTKVLRADLFVATLEQRSRGKDAAGKGRKGLKLIQVKFSNDDGQYHWGVYKAVNGALDFVFANKDVEMVDWLGHNVIRGLLQYLGNAALTWKSRQDSAGDPLHAIGGELALGEVGGRKFYRGWI